MFERKFLDFQGGCFEYVITKHLYNPTDGFGWAKFQIYNNEIAMGNMTINDVENIRTQLNMICDGMKEYVSEEKNYIYPNKIIYRDTARQDMKIRDRKIMEEYDKKGGITLAVLAEKYGISGERVRQIIKNIR